MAVEWAELAGVVVASAGVSALVTGWWTSHIEKAKRADDRLRVTEQRAWEAALLDEQRQRSDEAAYRQLCARVARAAGEMHGTAMSQLTAPASMVAELEAALMELSLSHGPAAGYAREWFEARGERTQDLHKWAKDFPGHV